MRAKNNCYGRADQKRFYGRYKSLVQFEENFYRNKGKQKAILSND